MPRPPSRLSRPPRSAPDDPGRRLSARGRFWNSLAVISETFGRRLRTQSGRFAYPFDISCTEATHSAKQASTTKGTKMNRTLITVAAAVLASVIGGSAFAVELPYTGNGDPAGLTSSKSPAALLMDAFETAAIALYVEVPYTGNGDPMGWVSGRAGLEFAKETSSAPRGTQIPYTGAGDPDDLI